MVAAEMQTRSKFDFHPVQLAAFPLILLAPDGLADSFAAWLAPVKGLFTGGFAQKRFVLWLLAGVWKRSDPFRKKKVSRFDPYVYDFGGVLMSPGMDRGRIFKGISEEIPGRRGRKRKNHTVPSRSDVTTFRSRESRVVFSRWVSGVWLHTVCHKITDEDIPRKQFYEQITRNHSRTPPKRSSIFSYFCVLVLLIPKKGAVR